MNFDTDFKVIVPKQSTVVPSSAHVHAGVPVPKSVRVQNFSPDEWEEFVEEWTTALNSYKSVCRFGGVGDYGIDIAGFYSHKGFKGAWDNYQCKRYKDPLKPSDVWVR